MRCKLLRTKHSRQHTVYQQQQQTMYSKRTRIRD